MEVKNLVQYVKFDLDEDFENPLNVLNMCSNQVTIAVTAEVKGGDGRQGPGPGGQVVAFVHYSVTSEN
jgi:hypothetical protein